MHHFGDWPLADLKASIDWTPFFRAWELAGNYPQILDDPVVGESARSLFADANAMLDQIIAERWVTPKATVGLWRCKRDGDDVLILAGNDWTRVPFLRQQVKKREGRANLCLADFINPDGEDWIGGFAVGIHGLEPHLERFKQTIDDYDDILLKALADRLAESFAEVLHATVRNRLWGYADEHFSTADLIREKFHGIRPAPGYPACPDHSLNPALFEMLGGNPGDAGLPMDVKWHLPAGFSAGPLRYPVPTRLTVAGLMNYVFERDYAVLVRLQVPAGAIGTVPVRADAHWLACTDKVCVPEQGQLALDLQVGTGTPNRAQF